VVVSTTPRTPRGVSLAIVLASALARLIIAALTPLFPDETYYWEWSRHPAAGYFDHPPAIAWLIRLGTLVAGNTPFGARLGAVLVGTLGMLFVCLAARRLAGERAAIMCALIFAVIPLSAAGLILATPDAPLFAAIAGTTYAVIRVFENAPQSRGSLLWWSVAGFALGVGLCSKYTAVLYPIGVLIALIARRELRPRLREPGPYLATLIALAVFLPILLWNAAHDWMSFAFQLQHGLRTTGGSPLKRELEFVSGQLGLVSPILFVMCVIAVTQALRSGASLAQRVLAVSAIVVFAFFMYSAIQRRVEPNWPAIAYVPGVLLLAAHVTTSRWNRWMRAGIGLAGLMTVAIYVNAFTPILPVPARRDPAARAHGWDDLARAVDSIYSPRRSISSYRTWVVADRYQEASQLAFHLAENPETFSLNLSSRPNNYDFWPSFPERAYPRDAIILVVDDVAGTHPTVALLEPHFTTVKQGALVALARNGDETKRLRIWLLERWRGTWPQRQLRSRS
jgi:4-amino-4-deoxy-L-arabinose transferase-like glycosyltransferase